MRIYCVPDSTIDMYHYIIAYRCIKEGEGEATAKLPSIMFSAPSLRCSSERFDRHLSVRPLYAGREKWKICDVRWTIT